MPPFCYICKEIILAKYICKRLVQLVPVIIGLTFFTYLLMYISPGDPAMKKLNAQGITVDSEVLEKTREKMNLNQPFLERYVKWSLKALTGDLGTSYKDEVPVISKIGDGMKYTLILAAVVLGFSVILSFLLGLISALNKNNFIDKLVRWFSFIGNSIPNFLLSVILIYIFCIKLKLLPVIADRSIRGLLLPVLALGIPLSSKWTRQIRAEILEQLSKEYVVCMKARGINDYYILFGNVLRNSAISIITIISLSFGTLMGGSVVIETIFRWNGIGKVVMDAISNRDYPVIQGFVLIMAIIHVSLSLITDISYKWVDPRIERQ